MIIAAQPLNQSKLNAFINNVHNHFAKYPHTKNLGTIMAFSHSNKVSLSTEEMKLILNDPTCTAESILEKRATQPARSHSEYEAEVVPDSTRKKATPEQIASLKKALRYIGNGIYYLSEAAIAYQYPGIRHMLLLKEAKSILQNNEEYLPLPIKRTLQMLESYLTLCLLPPSAFVIQSIVKLGNTIFPSFMSKRSIMMVNLGLIGTLIATKEYEHSPLAAIQRFIDENIAEYPYATYLIAPAYTLAFETTRPLLFSAANKVGTALSSAAYYAGSFLETTSEFCDAMYGQGAYYDGLDAEKTLKPSI